MGVRDELGYILYQFIKRLMVKVVAHQLTLFATVVLTQARHEPLAVSAAVTREYFSAIFRFHLSGSFFVCFSPFCAGAAQALPCPVQGCTSSRSSDGTAGHFKNALRVK